MIKLTLLKPEDCEEIVTWHEGKDENFLYQWTGPKKYEFPLSQQMIRSRILEEGTMIYKVLNDDEMIGTVELGKFNMVNQTATASRFLIREADCGKGYGADVMELLKEIVFEEIGFTKLKLNVQTTNTIAIQCYEKTGFEIVETNNRDNGISYYSMVSTKV